MNDTGDTIGNIAKRGKAATRKAASNASDAAQAAADQTLELARRAFEKIKADRMKTVKKSDAGVG